MRHSWPGNVRQLAQTVQRVYVFEDRIDAVLAEVFDAAAAPAARPLSQAQPATAAVAEPAASVEEEPRVPMFNLDALRRLAVR